MDRRAWQSVLQVNDGSSAKCLYFKNDSRENSLFGKLGQFILGMLNKKAQGSHLGLFNLRGQIIASVASLAPTTAAMR